MFAVMRIGRLDVVFGIGLLLMLSTPAVYRGFGAQVAIEQILVGFTFAIFAIVGIGGKSSPRD